MAFRRFAFGSPAVIEVRPPWGRVISVVRSFQTSVGQLFIFLHYLCLSTKQLLMSYYQLYYHIVFRTKDSMHAITEEYEKQFYAYVLGFLTNKECKLLRIGGMPDHVHMLVSIPPSIAISDCVRDIKIASHKFLREHVDKFPLFYGWAKSYCVLTCSQSSKDAVFNYIKNQKEHHKKTSFRDELLAFFREYEVDEEKVKFFLKD